jgi:ABC-type bacteriocin/lantibiotic exporter with double-glycine peptidase domain
VTTSPSLTAAAPLGSRGRAAAEATWREPPPVAFDATADLRRAIDLIADELRLTLPSERVWSAVSLGKGTALERLARGAQVAGISVALRHHAPRDVLRLVGRRAPAVTCVVRPDGGVRVIAALRRRGRRVYGVVLEDGVEQPLMLTVERLEALVGGEGAGVAWLYLEPAEPLGLLRLEGPQHELPPHKRAVERVRRLMRLERDDLGVVVVYALLVGAMSLATPVAVQALVNTVAFGTLKQPLVVLAIILLAALSFLAVLEVLQVLVVETLQQRMFVRVTADLAARLPKIRPDVFRERHGPELMNRFFDVVIVQKAGAKLLMEGLTVVLQTALGLLLLAFYHPLLLAFDIGLVVLIVLIVWGFGRGAVASAIAESDAKYAVAGWIEEISRTPALFRTRGGTAESVGRADALARRWLDSRQQHFRKLLRQIAGGFGLQVIASSALLGIGGWLVLERQLTLGQLIAAELVVAGIGAGVAKLGTQLENVYDLLAGLEKLGKLVDLPLDGRGREPLPWQDRPLHVQLHDVVLASPDGRPVVRGLELDVPPGGRVIVQGPTGSGKSSLLAAIAGLRAPASGSLLLDGVEVRHADPLDLRSQVAYVAEPEVIAGSVLDNLRIHRPDLEPPEARELLEVAGLGPCVRALPAGLDTRLLPGGEPLSAGQVRRLALARTLAAQPRLLLIDESFDEMGLSEPEEDVLFDYVLASERPWTAIVATDTDSHAMRGRCAQVLRLRIGERPSLEFVRGRAGGDETALEPHRVSATGDARGDDGEEPLEVEP